MAVSSCCSSTIIPFECRSSPDFQIPFGSARSNASKSSSPNPTATMFHGLSSSLIMRFPPNFVRQLSIKARRNCSNIGVAQVVAASWSNNLPSSNSSSSAANNKAAVDAVTSSLTTPVVDELVINNNVNCNDNGSVVQIGIEEEEEEKEVFEPIYGGFLSSDGSIAIHAGERVDRALITDTITTPVVNTSAYWFKKTKDLIDFKEKRAESFEYGRYGNYTTLALEKKMSALEGAESTIILASGMCASTVLLMALIPAGGHLVTTTDCYRKTRMFIENFLPKMGITSTVIDPADIKSLESALDKNKVSLFFTESPTNPFLRCVDIERVSKLCHDKGALVCIDGTFATPINQKALALGADIVVHSLTKFIAGHNDVLAGSISGPEKLISVVRNLHHILGGALNPNAAYLILRGMKTLHLRVRQHNSTAQKMAELLEAHPKITRVYYPGLASHPEHSLAKKQMSGFGGVVSFEVDGDLHKTAKFVDALKIPYIAPSFGGAESIVDQPAIMSYWDLPQEERAKYGILDNLVRFSFGLEDFEDLKADVLQALNAI